MKTKRERLEIISAVIVRRNLDVGYKQQDPSVIKAKATSYESHLTRKGVLPEHYDVIYELAVQAYNIQVEPIPFGVDHLLRAAESFYNGFKANEQFELVKKVPRKDCPDCKGTSLKYLENGRIEYEEIEGKKVAKRCDNCYESKNKEITS